MMRDLFSAFQHNCLTFGLTIRAFCLCVAAKEMGFHVKISAFASIIAVNNSAKIPVQLSIAKD